VPEGIQGKIRAEDNEWIEFAKRRKFIYPFPANGKIIITVYSYLVSVKNNCF